MAKKGNRIQVILECTEHKESGKAGTSRYITTKNKKIRQIVWRLKNSTRSLSV
ncbi:LSU ribosomal protein L33p [Nonlabens ulvanivorans]|uniref:Large ribosomal subunit protein bL33 n=1 Tax=Nonlabens ulvanivorans TaxID=906888 RepID=A0A090WDA3_NONUL|nr:LSU ribosomal protein L33p [Nonlabens ulvanivorans]